VLVADDGSRPDTAAVVDRWKGQLRGRVVHVWQPDEGFRLAQIRNRAILAASGQYCIFLDGDCLARPSFVAAHRALAERGCFVTGNRVLVSRGLSERILREQLTAERWSSPKWVTQWAGRSINRLLPLFWLPLGPLRHAYARQWRGARGANFAVWRSDLAAIDGFDAGFTGWGREDSDLFVRLIRSGVRRKDGRWATGVLHLWHPEADRGRLSENDRRLDESLVGDRIRATKGLSTLSVEPAISAP
jgi:glycosyltransferase involved in cell wall biosynthesis